MKSQPASPDITGDAVPFLSTGHQACVMVPSGPTAQEVWFLRSLQFKQWLRVRYENLHGQPPGNSWLRSTIEQLEARAIFGGQPPKPVGTRTWNHDDRIVLDLANSSGECVEITAAGWKTSEAFPYAFTRPLGMCPLPAPQTAAPGEHEPFDHFRSLLNIPSGNDWTRVLTFLTSAVTGLGPCPVLVLQGPSGSGKTTAARLLQSLIDPATGAPALLPASLSALRKHADGRRIVVFDDVQRMGPNKAAEIAHLADDETQPHAIILVRACSSTAALPETLERRALTVTLQQPQTLRTLYDLKQEFQRIHPQVLGALCDAVSQTLQRLHTTAQPALARLADATMLALAAAPALRSETTRILEAVAERPPLFATHPQPQVAALL